MPRVSVCIPVRNRADEVKRAVLSALDQTYGDLEVVVVDNASTDGTWETLRSLADADARVRIFRNETLIPRVRNWRSSVERARGEYVKLLFSDDWISETAVERAVGVLDTRPDVGFVYSAMTWHYATPQVCYRGHTPGLMPSLEFLVLSATVDDEVPVSASCTLARRGDLLAAFRDELPTRLPFDFSHGLGLDGTLLWRIADRYPYVFHVTEDLAHSADPHAGEPNTRMQIGDKQHEMMWWAYRNAFAHAVMASGRPARERRAMRTALFLSCVPLRPTAQAARHLALFRRMFPPPHRWWGLAPLAGPVRWLFRQRLREVLDPAKPL
jgi:glycosyltransferase involved in cell wall biosynthesis